MCEDVVASGQVVLVLSTWQTYPYYCKMSTVNRCQNLCSILQVHRYDSVIMTDIPRSGGIESRQPDAYFHNYTRATWYI
jgi:hypothetical protein